MKMFRMKISVKSLCRVMRVGLVLMAAESFGSTLTYNNNAKFTEYWQNDGRIGNTITVTVTNDYFALTNVDLIAAGWVTTSNVPVGLTASVTRSSTSTVVFALSGGVTNHTSPYNVSNVVFQFQDGAFVGGVGSAAAATNNGTNLVVAFLAQVASNWWVSPTGSDANAGTNAATALATVAAAVTKAQTAANDVIHILSGVYTQNNISVGTKIVTVTGNSSVDTILQAAATPFTTNKNILNFNNYGMVKNLTLRHGSLTNGNGGAVALAAVNEFYFDSCLFASNSAPQGGAVMNSGNPVDGFLTFLNCRFMGNCATGGYGGGAICTYKSAITVSNCSFLGNVSGASGGAISKFDATSAGEVLVYDSAFIGNSATNSGGAIFSAAGIGVVSNSCLSGNSAGISGGGLNFSAKASLPVLICNSTLSRNTAGKWGGGVYMWANVGAKLRIYNSTLFANSAVTNGGGIYTDAGAPYELYSSIVASNAAITGPDIGVYSGGAGTIMRSLIGDNSGSGTGVAAGDPTAGGNYIGTSATPINPELLPLADNGGLRLTCALAATSRAVNHGTNTLNLVYDGRGVGFDRVYGAQCDIGAYEFGSQIRVLGSLLMVE